MTVSINTPSAKSPTRTANATATVAPSPLLVHASAATSYYSGRATRLLPSALPGPSRTLSSSRAVIGTDDGNNDDNAEEKLDFLSNVSDPDQPDIMTTASVVAELPVSGAGAPLRVLGRAVSYATSPSVSWASHPHEEGEAGVLSVHSSSSDSTPAGGGDFDSLRSISTLGGGKASATVASPSQARGLASSWKQKALTLPT